MAAIHPHPLLVLAAVMAAVPVPPTGRQYKMRPRFLIPAESLKRRSPTNSAYRSGCHKSLFSITWKTQVPVLTPV
jgi:hypothetical protein